MNIKNDKINLFVVFDFQHSEINNLFREHRADFSVKKYLFISKKNVKDIKESFE